MRVIAQLMVLAAPILVAVIAAWTHRLLTDDGFINLRVISQIVHGHGPVFNQGQRVEAYTSPLWILILLIGDVLLPLRLEWIAVLGGIGLLAVGLATAMAASARLQGGARKRWFVPAGVLVFAVLPPVWKFSADGLETGLSVAWLGISALLLATWANGDRRLGPVAAVVIGLGVLVRPEMAIFTVAFLAVVLIATPGQRWRDRAVTVALALAVPLAYQIFRMGYFGMLLPNTALAKSAGASRWGYGWDYVRYPLTTYWLWIPLIVLAAAGVAVWRRAPRRPQLVAGAFVIGALLNILYVMRVGGDYWPSRLVLPALFALLIPVAVIPVERRWLPALAIAPWALVTLLWVRSPFDRHLWWEGPAHAVTLAQFGWGPGGPARKPYEKPGVYEGDVRLPVGVPPNGRTLVILGGIGLPSYGLGPNVDILDYLGLAQPIASHEKLRRRGYPGHEKLLPAPWIAALAVPPGAPLNPHDFPSSLPPMNFGVRTVHLLDQDDPRGRPFAERVATARHVLDCHKMRDFLAAFEAPLTPGRFLSNLTGSFGRTTFDIPPEPADAESALC